MCSTITNTTQLISYYRKANMTLDKSLKLCQRRRPVADPIPAFIEQLKAYEKECRSWGHLTSVEKASGDDIIGSVNGNSGEKRKAEDSSGDDGRKKRAVGPSIGPIGPVRPPTKPKGAYSDEKGGKDEKRVVGPAKRPPIGPMKPPSSS